MPVPAAVQILPSVVTLRTRWPENSEMYKLPAASVATLRGVSRGTPVARAPSAAAASVPPPATVAMAPSGAMRRTRLFPRSATYRFPDRSVASP